MEAAGLSSWMRGFLLPSLWEAEVAVSAAALLVAALLLLFLDQAVQSSTKSPASSSSPPPSPTTTAAASCRRDGGCGGCGCRRRRAKGKPAAAELGGTSKVSHIIFVCIAHLHFLLNYQNNLFALQVALPDGSPHSRGRTSYVIKVLAYIICKVN